SVDIGNLPISVLVEPFNGPVYSTNHLFWLPTLSFQSSDLYLETLDNLRGMLGLTRRFSFCLLDRQLQLSYLLCQALSFGFEIVYLGLSACRSFIFLHQPTL